MSNRDIPVNLRVVRTTALTLLACSAAGCAANPTDSNATLFVTLAWILGTIFLVFCVVVFAIWKLIAGVWRRADQANATPPPTVPAGRPDLLTYDRGDVIWMTVEFESGPDADGRTEKDRPVLIWGFEIPPVGPPVLRGFPMTSKVDKYRDRPGYHVVHGNWDGPLSTSCVNFTRELTFGPELIRRRGGRVANLNDLPASALSFTKWRVTL